MEINSNFFLTVNSNIFLRPLREDDADNLFYLVDINRKYLRKYLGWLDQNLSRSDTLYFIKKETSKRVKQEALTLGIIYLNKLVGVIAMNDLDFMNRSIDIGYWLSESHQGKGIITKSVEKIVQFSFEKLKIHRVEIRCAFHNHKSQKVPKRLGFEKEGILRESIYHYGKYYDACIYCKINNLI